MWGFLCLNSLSDSVGATLAVALMQGGASPAPTVFPGNACGVQKGNCTFVARFPAKPLNDAQTGDVLFLYLMENQGEVILYQPDNEVKLEVRLEEETVWLTQAQMAELFQTSKQNVSLHTNNIFKEKELSPDSVVKESLTTAADGRNTGSSIITLMSSFP